MAVLFRNHEYLFDQIKPLVPPDSFAVIEDQKRRIRDAIDTEVDKFGAELANYVKQEIAAEEERRQKALGESRASLDDLMKSIAETPAESTKLRELTAKLKGEIDAYEKKWKDLGEAAGAVVKRAVKASIGIPI